MNLKNHPFAVEAFFKCSTVLTFAVNKSELEKFIPKKLTLDTFNNEWGFLAVVMVQTKNLRPKGFPKIMGNDFFLIGYRIFVKYTNIKGKRLRGLYILKSETDKKRMAFFGNIFTHYNYSSTDINIKNLNGLKTISSSHSNFKVSINYEHNMVTLPNNSPFNDWTEARRYAGPLPHTFTVNVSKNEVLTIKGNRKDWKPIPVVIDNYYFEFINSLNFKSLMLANAFEINEIPYHWDKGSLDKWN